MTREQTAYISAKNKVSKFMKDEEKWASNVEMVDPANDDANYCTRLQVNRWM